MKLKKLIKFAKKLNMENNNWEVKWVTNELTKSLEYWEKQNNESMSLYKVEIGGKTISMDERTTITPIYLNGKRIKITVTEE
jgi:hypothetical protein